LFTARNLAGAVTAMVALPQLIPILYSLFTLANANNYFSEGWKPGQGVRSLTTSSNAPVYTPVPQAASPTSTDVQGPKFGFFDQLFMSGPINSLLGAVGLNMTQKMLDAKAEQANKWDQRIPLITDDNYNELIVNAEPSSEDEVWFIIM
jgi:hypothetical protein